MALNFFNSPHKLLNLFLIMGLPLISFSSGSKRFKISTLKTRTELSKDLDWIIIFPSGFSSINSKYFSTSLMLLKSMKLFTNLSRIFFITYLRIQCFSRRFKTPKFMTTKPFTSSSVKILKQSRIFGIYNIMLLITRTNFFQWKL